MLLVPDQSAVEEFVAAALDPVPLEKSSLLIKRHVDTR